jgi:rare lipoprotein A (peptidoglycan hydrolase)
MEGYGRFAEEDRLAEDHRSRCRAKESPTKEQIGSRRSRTSRSLARTAILSTLVGIGLSALASDRLRPANIPRQSDRSQHHWFEIGKASWYGKKFDGRRTASGEKFDMHELTCAHRTLPLGSWVRITNLRNHRIVFARVNDRGPMIDDRVIDLSYAAAVDSAVEDAVSADLHGPLAVLSRHSPRLQWAYD